jgi:two-component system nitrogen regulation response regulator NtrX
MPTLQPPPDECPNTTVEEETSDLDTLRGARAVFEKQFIMRMLSENGGNISKTAQRIGLERSHLHKKMKAYGIDTTNTGI